VCEKLAICGASVANIFVEKRFQVAPIVDGHDRFSSPKDCAIASTAALSGAVCSTITTQISGLFVSS
jgi:hypothetical protein